MSFTFYLGTHEPSWLARSSVPLFVSFRRLARRVSLPRAVVPWMLDSGGFTELQMYGRWSVSPRRYAAAVCRYQRLIGNLVAAAPQDWMCEPIVIKGGRVGPLVFAGTGLSVLEHQRRTVANFVKLSRLAPSVPWMPVVQGWCVDDYLRCVGMYEAAGVSLASFPVVGVGSVCRRQATTEAAEIFEALHSLGLKLHGFGLKTAGLPACAPFLASSDSLAWSTDARYSAPLPGHSHKNCANCYPYALSWRDRVIAASRRPAPPRQLAFAF